MKTLFSSIVALVLMTGVSNSGVMCGPSKDISAVLVKDYGEVLQSVSLAIDQKTTIEIFVNKKTGTMTMLAVGESGTACFIAGGTAYKEMADGGGI